MERTAWWTFVLAALVFAYAAFSMGIPDASPLVRAFGEVCKAAGSALLLCWAILLAVAHLAAAIRDRPR